jgi:hypothetical protein
MVKVVVFGVGAEVEGIGDERAVLPVEVAEEDERGGIIEVLALGNLGLFTVTISAGEAGIAVVLLAQMNSAVTSPPGTEIQLN